MRPHVYIAARMGDTCFQCNAPDLQEMAEYVYLRLLDDTTISVGLGNDVLYAEVCCGEHRNDHAVLCRAVQNRTAYG